MTREELQKAADNKVPAQVGSKSGRVHAYDIARDRVAIQLDDEQDLHWEPIRNVLVIRGILRVVT